MEKNIQIEYKIPVTVASYDVGQGDGMRLSALLRYQQEAADRHLTTAGVSWRELSRQGLAFVTSRWHTVITRLPQLEEPVILTTWHREQKGPRFFRCFEWTSAQGRVLVEGVMVYALVDTESHRLLRGEEFARLVEMPQPLRGVAAADPTKFRLPIMLPAGEYPVRRSVIDRNGHMNNTRYADLVEDFLPFDLAGREPVDVQLHFAGESRLGDTLQIARGREARHIFGVRGEHDRGEAFSARIEVGESRGV